MENDTLVDYNQIFSTENLEFNEEEHKYSLVNSPEQTLTSVTTFIHEFFPKFDSVKVANKLVTENAKYKDKTADDLLKEWKGAADDGTLVHNTIEDYILEYNKLETSPEYAPFFTEDMTKFHTSRIYHALEWLNSKLISQPHLKLLPEVKIYSEYDLLAGTIDLIVHNTDKDVYTIIDWKTNKRIYRRSYKGEKGTKYATRNLEHCNFNAYSLQLSCYRYILEEEYGLTIKNQALVHLEESGLKVIKCPNLRQEIEEMLKEGVI